MSNVQESVSVDSNFALGQVTSVPKEQNLPALFNEGENSQVRSTLSCLTSNDSHSFIYLYILTSLLDTPRWDI